MTVPKPETYRKKVLGAWLGKAVGGSLGAPWEGSTGPNTLTFYNPVPDGMMPNDDLDLQVVWACRLESDWNGVVSLSNFADAWLKNIEFPCDEYGVVLRNLRRGVPPPFTGQLDNWFTDGLGGAIRSEIWAILSPGDPHRAAAFARVDASLDHAGNGVWAEQFLAALESAAFIESDIHTLIETGLSVIPADSGIAHSVRDAMNWCDEALSFLEIRRRILAHHGNANFTDVKMNLAFETAALLLGKGDFAASICAAVNFGQDTDCTGATVGAILGIVAPDSIPEAWLAPIGRDLTLNEGINGIDPPPTLDAFTDMLIRLRDRVTLREEDFTEITTAPDLRRFALTARSSVLRPFFANDFRKLGLECLPATSKSAKRIQLSGNVVEIDFENLPKDALQLFEIDFTLDAAQTVRFLVCSPANVLVWIDRTLRFNREGGPMVPAFHRAPANTRVDLALAQGRHTLAIGLAPLTEEMHAAPLVFGLADTRNHWLPQFVFED